MTLRMVWIALALLASAQLFAGQDAEREGDRARVLLFGDISFQSHHRHAATALKAEADVVQSPHGYLHSGAVLERYGEVFGDGAWDVVCLNCGLSDMMFRDPRSREIRAMSAQAGGVQVTPIEEHVANLEALVLRLRGDGARVVWTTTLPLHPHRRKGAAVVAEYIERFNAAAVERLRALSVTVVDTHSDLMDELAKAENPRQVDRMHNDLLKGDPSGPLVAQLRRVLAE